MRVGLAFLLLRFKYICCATPSYLAKYGDPLTIWTFEVDGTPQKFDLSGKFTASDNDLLKKAALNHHGIARLPEYMIKQQLATGELVALIPNFEPEHRDIYLVYPQMNTRPSRVKLCLEAIVDGVG